MSKSEPRDTATWSAAFRGGAFGAFLVVVGATFLIHSISIERTGVSSIGDPGARIFPLALSLALLVAGQAYLVLALTGRRSDRAPVIRRDGYLNVWLLSVVMAVALPLIPQVGFSLTMSALCVATLTRLGARWYMAAVASVILIGLVKLMFTTLFEVQLPEGELWERLF